MLSGEIVLKNNHYYYYMYVCVLVYLCVYASVCMNEYMCTSMCTCISVYVYIYVCEHLFCMCLLLIRKYSQLVDTDFVFVPVAVETSGIIGSASCSLLSDVGRRISRATNDPRQMSCIFQHISVAIIRGNALAMTASSRRYAQELFERH